MSLVQRVVFTYNITDYMFNQSGTFLTIDELKDCIASVDCTRPHALYVEREIQIIDTDIKPEKSADMEIFGNPDPSVKSKIPTHRLHFTVVDKLWFKPDVCKALKKKYGSAFDLNELVSNNETPVISFYVLEQPRTGMVVNDRSTHYTLHSLHCTPATKQDIIVNKKLEQLWPQPGAVPSVLTNLLLQTKENIKEA